MGMCSTQTGTPYYASPEVWGDKPYDYKKYKLRNNVTLIDENLQAY